MASRTLQWLFGLRDQMSGPARQQCRALETLETTLKSTSKAVTELERTQRRAAAAKAADPLKREIALLRLKRDELRAQREELRRLHAEEKRAGSGGVAAGGGGHGGHGGMHGSGGMFGKALGYYFGAQMALMAARGIGELVFGPPVAFMKSALGAASYRESNSIALETLLGSKTKGDAVMREAVRMAAVTPFETREVMGWYKDLIGGGFKPEELRAVVAAASDTATLKGDPQYASRVIRAVTQIKAKGRVQGEELLQLAEAGVPTIKMYEKMGKLLKMDTDQVRKLIEAGRVPSSVGVWAFVKTLEELGGGKLGLLSERTSHTLEGLWSTLKSRSFELLMNLDRAPGFEKWKNAIGNIADVFDPESASGQRLVGRATSLFDRISGGLLESFQSKEGVEAWLNRMMDSFERSDVIGKFGTLADNVGKLAANLDKVVTAAEKLGKVGSTLVDYNPFARTAKEGGKTIWQALDALDLGGLFNMKKVPISIPPAGPTSAPAPANIATAPLWSPPDFTRRTERRAAGPLSFNGRLDIHVHGASGGDAESLRRAAREGAQEALAAFTEGLALEAGV